MKCYKNVIIGLRLDESPVILRSIAGYEFLKTSTITLVHLVRNTDYTLPSGANLSLYANPDAKIVIEEAVKKRMEETKQMVTPKEFGGRIHSECLFSHSFKRDFCQRAQALQCDLMILPLRDQRLGSFADFQLTHSRIPVLLVKRAN